MVPLDLGIGQKSVRKRRMKRWENQVPWFRGVVSYFTVVVENVGDNGMGCIAYCMFVSIEPRMR